MNLKNINFLTFNKMTNEVSLLDIISFLDMDLKNVFGNPNDIIIKHFKPPSLVDEFTLDWINADRQNKLEIINNSPAKAILVKKEMNINFNEIKKNKVLLFVDNPKLAVAKVGNHFFVKKPMSIKHPTAIVHPEAILGNEVFIDANVVIGKASIGNNVIIYANVTIADGVVIGNNVIIKAGAKLGFEGFGFEKDVDGNLIKFPQLGGLIIHDDVEIGCNTCIDRGSLSNTMIGQGTKINNLCHIAHNTIIGKNVIITAQVNVSGSTIIGDNVWIAPNASLRGHQKIGDNAIIGMGAIVTKDIPYGETWVGNPAKKI